MAYAGWKDITTVTWNGKALMAWVDGISGLKYSALLHERTPVGTAWSAPQDTGQRQQEDIVITFLYDSASTPTPNVDVTIGLSATLLITLRTGESVTGTFIVSDLDIAVTPEKLNLLTATFKPSGTITWDLAA